MDKQDIYNLVNQRIKLAYETIKESESHLQNNFLNTAMNRIYYAGFYIVNALAALDNFSTSKHKQLIGYFNKEYIKSGKVDKKVGEILSISYDRREEADYHDFVVLTKAQVDNYRIRMTEFIDKVNSIIQERL